MYYSFIACHVSLTKKRFSWPYISFPRHIRKRLATQRQDERCDPWFEKHSMNSDEGISKIKTCAVVCNVLIKIRRIIASKLYYSSWLPTILQKIDKTLDENYVWTLLFLFTSLSVVLRLRDIPKKRILSIPKWWVAPPGATAMYCSTLEIKVHQHKEKWRSYVLKN